MNKVKIINTFKIVQKIPYDQDYVPRQIIYNNFIMNELVIPSKDQNYMMMRLHRYTGDLKQMPYRNMVTILEDEADPVEAIY